VARVLALCALAACAFAVTAGAAIYPGKSQGLMPTPAEIGFTHLLAFKPAQKPVAALNHGYKNGVSGLFQKGTTKAPIEVVVTVYVYSSTAAAKLAWQKSCTKCTVVSAPLGIRLKAQAGTLNKLPALREVSVCGNVYLDATEEGSGTTAKLDADVAKVVNGVFGRAVAHGLSSCTAK
jgi:hypothetical protein